MPSLSEVDLITIVLAITYVGFTILAAGISIVLYGLTAKTESREAPDPLEPENNNLKFVFPGD